MRSDFKRYMFEMPDGWSQKSRRTMNRRLARRRLRARLRDYWY